MIFILLWISNSKSLHYTFTVANLFKCLSIADLSQWYIIVFLELYILSVTGFRIFIEITLSFAYRTVF